MSDQPYMPSGEKIDEVLAKYTPRQIAIAYLKALRRARQAENFGKAMEAVQDMTVAVFTGNVNLAEGAAKKAQGLARAGREIQEARHDQ